MEELHGWIFTYNQYTRRWSAVTREDYPELFNGGKHTVTSSDINTLITLIIRHKSVDNIKETIK